MVTNATIEALLGRRSIRKFKDEAIDDDTRATLETVAQHAASSQFLNDWSAIRITDPATKAKPRIQFVSATLVFGLAAFDCSLAISSSHTSLGVL